MTASEKNPRRQLTTYVRCLRKHKTKPARAHPSRGGANTTDFLIPSCWNEQKERARSFQILRRYYFKSPNFKKQTNCLGKRTKFASLAKANSQFSPFKDDPEPHQNFMDRFFFFPFFLCSPFAGSFNEISFAVLQFLISLTNKECVSRTSARALALAEE